MILADTSDLIRVISSTTGDIEVSADWVDWTTTTFTPGHTTTLITTATTTTIIASPAASTQRQAKGIVVANRHASTSMGVTVEHFDGTNAANVWQGTLLAGESVIYDGAKWVRYNASGMIALEDAVVTFDGTTYKVAAAGGGQALVATKHLIRADTDETLTSTTSEQPFFDQPTNGRLTIAVGTYSFEWTAIVTGMSPTSGNARLDILGAGSAVLANHMSRLYGLDNSTPSTIADDDCVYLQADTTAASCVTAGTGTALRFWWKGFFECSTPGTVQPAIALVTAAAAVVESGSQCEYERIGDQGLISVGSWD